eukprot:TRINITY_DN45174_c0_g1_i1.p1 TRINITY_DN45174_c0_g1~~TRINITY_DN45174_c0_g1_i1.p1  ORF type:complete len:208 (-),score=22.70 TRINITY_DN45174_c0_g1_i1:78-701(-)
MSHLLRPPSPPKPGAPPPPFFPYDASQSKSERFGPQTLVISHGPDKVGSFFAGSWRPNRKEDIARALGGNRSASEGRLSSSASSSHTRRLAGDRIGPETSMNEMWTHLAPLTKLDHVASLMQQPLPTKGWDNADYGKRNAFGTLPTAPRHLLAGQSSAHLSYIHNQEYARATRAQKKSEQWRGLQRDNNTEFTEQRVKQSHIMRGGK